MHTTENPLEGLSQNKRFRISIFCSNRNLRIDLSFLCGVFVLACILNAKTRSTKYLHTPMRCKRADLGLLPVCELSHVGFFELAILVSSFPCRPQHTETFQRTSGKLRWPFVVLRESSGQEETNRFDHVVILLAASRVTYIPCFGLFAAVGKGGISMVV